MGPTLGFMLVALAFSTTRTLAVGSPCTLPDILVITDPAGDQQDLFAPLPDPTRCGLRVHSYITDPAGENITLQDITRSGTEFTVTNSP